MDLDHLAFNKLIKDFSLIDILTSSRQYITSNIRDDLCPAKLDRVLVLLLDWESSFP